MSIESPSVDPTFFGKDSFVPFIGQVEDVNDPKRSGRVKVRCVGWHPRDKTGSDDALSTDDLPWARVGMPTTHAQQSRIGGKHGLLPGSWVFGFFLDGDDAQDPFVLSTFNFTAKASTTNNRQDGKVTEGKIDETIPGFTKINSEFNRNFPNFGLLGESEKDKDFDKASGDPAGDTGSLDDSVDGECPLDRPLSTGTREGERRRGAKGTGEGQIQDVAVGDGKCGAAIAAFEEIQSILKDQYPPKLSRFNYGDLVWHNITDQYMSINGIFNKIAVEVGPLMNESINAGKAVLEDTINRTLMNTSNFASADRDGLIVQVVNQSVSGLADAWHGGFAEIIQQLFTLVMNTLQSIEDDEDPISIATNIITGVQVITSKKEKESSDDMQESSDGFVEDGNESRSIVDEQIPDEYEDEDEMQEELDKDYNDKNGGNEESNDGSDLISAGMGMIMAYLTKDKYALKNMIFNKAGILTQDILFNGECKSESFRLFNTEGGLSGALSTIQSTLASGGSSSGGSGSSGSAVSSNSGGQQPGVGAGSGSNSSGTKKSRDLIGFGGIPISEPNSPDNSIFGGTEVPITITNTTTDTILDSERESILNSLERFKPVDLYEPGRIYDLKGEVEINGTITNSSRVFVNSQQNPMENGIYITSNKEWKRSEDANSSSDFLTDKVVEVPSQQNKFRWHLYTGVNRPRVEKDDINFSPIFISRKTS